MSAAGRALHTGSAGEAPPRRGGPALVLSRTHAIVLLGMVVLGAAVLIPVLGRLGVLAFAGAGMCVLFLARDRLTTHAADTAIFLLPCLVALASAATSLHPRETIWYGTQYAVSALVFYALALSLPLLALMRIASLAIWAGLALSVAFPAYHYVGHTGEIAFVGIFSSKNNYSFVVGALVMLGAGQCAAGGPMGRAYGLASVALGFAFLLAGRSLGAIVGASAALALAGAFLSTRVFHRSVLAPAIVMGATLAAVMGLWLVAEFELVTRWMVAVGRDPTLTGRTLLWELAWENFTSAPLLGVGYRGFFVPYYPPAVEVLEYFHLPPTAAWHHHNAFFDILAGTGLLGIAAHAILLGRVLGLFAGGIARDRLRAADAGIVAAFAYLALRSALEVDFTVEYSLGLFLYALVHATLARRLAEPTLRQRRTEPRAPERSSTPRRRRR
ncbi:O-antigen ligase family protein [Salinarimonas ramus]|uniref:O-antigen polymerase n=1 Tax=Salinarimonas ramus TaxID=690164 RepID=A0A917V4E2_9HYPH|nr:O-antigen ligase family protein [Salinarimonas ramus]GGK38161.1 O-antigen polymerase [Salinarimonas ramus]